MHAWCLWGPDQIPRKFVSCHVVLGINPGRPSCGRVALIITEQSHRLSSCWYYTHESSQIATVLIFF